MWLNRHEHQSTYPQMTTLTAPNNGLEIILIGTSYNISTASGKASQKIRYLRKEARDVKMSVEKRAMRPKIRG